MLNASYYRNLGCMCYDFPLAIYNYHWSIYIYDISVYIFLSFLLEQKAMCVLVVRWCHWPLPQASPTTRVNRGGVTGDAPTGQTHNKSVNICVNNSFMILLYYAFHIVSYLYVLHPIWLLLSLYHYTIINICFCLYFLLSRWIYITTV